MSGTAPGRPRGSVGVYAVAFLLLVGSAVALAASAAAFLASARLLWASIGLSTLALALAAVSVLVRR